MINIIVLQSYKEFNNYSFLNENTFYLHNSSVEIDGLQIWGSPYPPTFFNWAFNVDRGKEIEKIWKDIPRDTDILITHGPPFGILDQTHSNQHVGCEELLKKIYKIQPQYHLFGHIHEAYGIFNTEKTTFINGSVLNEHYEMVNLPITFECGGKT
ncbi:metallophosphoesterase family protein [Kaistella treverensis]|uniref:metallophosphoesterase family protein n=1 Tax=Kaistella treverensis TaxID=631455 RepID=UPI00116063E7|nr:metallophosphoesterase [Kaistella treverensis]